MSGKEIRWSAGAGGPGARSVVDVVAEGLRAGVKVYEIMRDDDRLFARAVDGRPRKTEDS
ncbi:MAG: hypothetical protein FJX67_01730 [Alphaproteobacteria bacterium]|nr:hypothetical protein [Alphaproteobacteria bacterium]